MIKDLKIKIHIRKFFSEILCDKKNLIIFFLLFTSIILLVANLINRKEKLSINMFLEKKIEERKGSPIVFRINNIPYSAKKFSNEMIFERKNFDQKLDFPEPLELKKFLDSYIDETILLDTAMSELDLNQPEVYSYLWPFFRKGIISYYLNKKSGIIDLNKTLPKKT